MYVRICVDAHVRLWTRVEMQDFIKAVKAISDETRLRILSLLIERECCVCEVMQALEISQTRASRNLGILEDAGFLKSRREGLWVLYSLDWQGGEYIVHLAKLVKNKTKGNPLFLADEEKLKIAVRLGPGCVERKCISGRMVSPDGKPRK
jgi:ArsR family transcriptional regulator